MVHALPSSSARSQPHCGLEARFPSNVQTASSVSKGGVTTGVGLASAGSTRKDGGKRIDYNSVLKLHMERNGQPKKVSELLTNAVDGKELDMIDRHDIRPVGFSKNYTLNGNLAQRNRKNDLCIFQYVQSCEKNLSLWKHCRIIVQWSQYRDQGLSGRAAALWPNAIHCPCLKLPDCFVHDVPR